MSTSADTVTGTEASRPGLRARVKRMSRTARLAALLGLAAAATLATTALPASASTNPPGFNYARAQTVAGTDCTITVGTYYNTSKYPGTALWAYCSTGHMISMYAELQTAPMAGGTWSVWGRSPTYNYSYIANTGYQYSYRASCGGPELQWRVMAYISVDGHYRGEYAADGVHDWVACH